MAAEAVLATLQHLWRTLKSLDLSAALMGGIALSIWKHPRFTKDVDVLVAISDEETNRLIEVMTNEGFRSKRPDPLVRVGEAEFLQFLYEPPETFIDVQVDLLLVRTEYQQQSIQRSVHIRDSDLGFDLDVMSCEDLIIHKLLAGRMIDFADAAAICRANRDSLDYRYLRDWISRHRLESDFAAVWDEAFPGDEPPTP